MTSLYAHMKCTADPFVACTNFDCINGGCVRKRPPQWTFVPVQRGCICPPTSEQTCMNPQCGRKPVTSALQPAGFGGAVGKENT